MPQRKYVSTDPSYGSSPSSRKYISTDPNFGVEVNDPFAGQELRNAPSAPPPTLRDKAKVLAMRSATGGAFDSWDDARDWFFGSEERNRMQAEGYGMAAPTPIQMVEMPLTLLAPEMAPALVPVAGAERAAGAGRMARVVSNPKVLAAAEGSLPGILHRDPVQAAEGAAAGLLLGHLMGRGGARRAAAPEASGVPAAEPSWPAAMSRGDAEAHATGLIRAGRPEESRAFIEAVRAGKVRLLEPQGPLPPSRPIPPPSAPEAAVVAGPERPGTVVQGPMAKSPNTKMATIYQPGSSTLNTPAGRAAAGKLPQKGVGMIPDQLRAIEEAGGADNPLLGGKAPEAPAKPKPAAPKVDRGKEAVAAHGDLRSAAREYGKANPDVDQIYFELDKSGRPVRVISQGQAGALTRKGIKWTWVNNVWGNPRNLRTGS